MVLAIRASGCLFGHPNPEKAPLRGVVRAPKYFLWGISKNINLKNIIEFLHLHIIPMNKDIMPYFDQSTHVYGWNLSILWSPLKFWMPQNFTIANFGHPVSKSWLRPWLNPFSLLCICYCYILIRYLLTSDNSKIILYGKYIFYHIIYYIMSYFIILYYILH